jgi:2Fe-2S ferredoxin
VFVAPHPAVPPRSTLEDEMLDVTAVPRTDESRLSCQIFVTAEMDGLEVRLPETQL